MAAPVTDEQLEKLRPFIAGAASQAGEIDIYCPMHNDSNRSAQLNVNKGVWYCQAGCGGGTVSQLVEHEHYWIPAEGRVKEGGSLAIRPCKPPEALCLPDVREWHEALMEDVAGAGTRLASQRGISEATAIKFMLGWDGKRKVYTIPVRSAGGKLWNVRRYDMDAGPDRRKIWGLRGRNTPRLFPAAVLLIPPDFPIIVCEGEWDAMLTLQMGFPAITRTGAAHVWKAEWTKHFAGREVFICHDRDEMGDLATNRLRAVLEPVADVVRTVTLPFEWAPKHGKDLTDFWSEGGTHMEFAALMAAAA